MFSTFDASAPPAEAYPGTQGVCGYIGGNTPHVWTVAEWLRFSHLLQLPIWTGYKEDDPAGHARAAATAARDLGWIPHRKAGWRAIALDMEDETDEAWVNAFGVGLRAAGFLCWPYLALSALGSDPHGYSVWLPEWNGVPEVPPLPNVIGHQYRGNVSFAGTSVDLSVWDSKAFSGFGVGPRH